MQEEGTPKFLKFHQGYVRSVAFSPRDRYLFCSGGYDGKVNLCSALRSELLMSYQVLTAALARRAVYAVKFTIDGSKILAATTGSRLAVVDVERGEQLLAYENCLLHGRDHASIAIDPVCPNVAVCVTVNGRGLTLFDLRMPLPLDFLYEIHHDTIRDVMFLHPSWPWSLGHQSTILTTGSDGTCNVSGFDGRTLHSFFSGQVRVNTVCPTPELFNQCAEDGFYSMLMCGGDVITSYLPDFGLNEIRREIKSYPIWKLRYTSNGSLLYAACEDGTLRRYRRYPDRHEYLGEVFSHKGNIRDLDISPYDEYLITASRDKTVGILRLGAPNHGWTEYSELT